MVVTYTQNLPIQSLPFCEVVCSKFTLKTIETFKESKTIAKKKNVPPTLALHNEHRKITAQITYCRSSKTSLLFKYLTETEFIPLLDVSLSIFLMHYTWNFNGITRNHTHKMNSQSPIKCKLSNLTYRLSCSISNDRIDSVSENGSV